MTAKQFAGTRASLLRRGTDLKCEGIEILRMLEYIDQLEYENRSLRDRLEIKQQAQKEVADGASTRA